MASWTIDRDNAEAFLKGMSTFGTGGGGSPEAGRGLIYSGLEAGRSFEFIDPYDVPDDFHICFDCLSGLITQPPDRRFFMCLSEPYEGDPHPDLPLYMPFPYKGFFEKAVPSMKFHSHPELGLQEFNTCTRIEEELNKLGITNKRVAGTNVIARTFERSCKTRSKICRVSSKNP